MAESLSRTLARFIASLSYDSLPLEVVDKIKASLLHNLVIAIVGSANDHATSLVRLVRDEESRPDGATILADGARVTRSGAAFANSTLMHTDNQTDSYRMLVHPGPCIVPAALATAELDGATGRELLVALVAAYETELRIAGDFIPSTQARGFRSSPVYGTFGAAVATSRLLGLSEDRLVAALALAATYTAGTTEGPRTGGREMLYQEPQAARSGILAALLAREGASGAETALEGEAGFYNAFTGNYSGELSYVFHGGSRQVELASVVADLGSRWELMHVTPKIYPTAGFNCPVIELMTAMRAERDMPAAEIERITIEMNWLETSYPSPAFTAPRRPRAGPGSTAYIAAHTCIHGDYPSLAWQRPTAADPAVLELVDRVEVVGYEDRPAFAPRITVRMLDGTEHRGELQGDELEWDFATEVRRITALFDEIPWPRERLDDLVDAVSSIEALPSIDAIVRLLVPPAQNSE